MENLGHIALLIFNLTIITEIIMLILLLKTYFKCVFLFFFLIEQFTKKY